MQKLRQICQQSPRLKQLNDIEYQAYKKEIGAIEIAEMEDYFLEILEKRITVDNRQVNSMVAYLIGIAEEKPLGSVKYKGGTIPDIDIDFPDADRLHVLQYVIDKYGSDKVAGLSARNYIWAKNALRTAARVLGYDFAKADQYAKLIPAAILGRAWTFKKIMDPKGGLKEFQKAYEKDEDLKRIVDHAIKLEGLIKSPSQHAAGYVISSVPINEVAPVWRQQDKTVDGIDIPIVEFTMQEAEELGLIKMDFLGLSTLNVIKTCLELIEENRGIKLTLDDIPLDDPATYKFMAEGRLLGIFQFEGDGISRVVRDFQPTNLNDITLINAAFRPGPMEFLKEIIIIRNGGQPTHILPHGERFPLVKDIFKDTYGYFIYQEQIQRLVQDLAGYSDHEGDEFRKIVAKKITEKMAKEKVRFTEKAMQKGMSLDDINALWSEMESFSNYAFNKSHALAYSVLAVKTAYLKTHYRAEFYTANIITDIGDQESVTAFLKEAEYYGIKLYPPDINRSYANFRVIDDKTILFGLGGIKNVGVQSAEAFMAERQKHGLFKSLSDFIYRTDVKSNVLEQMIKSGAFSSMIKISQVFAIKEGETRYIDYLLKFIKHYKTKEWSLLPFKKEWISFPEMLEYDDEKLAAFELETLGLNIKYDPFERYRLAIAEAKKKNENMTYGIVKKVIAFKSGKGALVIVRTLNNKESKYIITSRKMSSYKNMIKTLEGSAVGVSGIRTDDPEESYWLNSMSVIKLPERNEQTKYDIPLEIRSIPLLDQLYNKLSKTNGKYQIYGKFIGQSYTAEYLLGLAKIKDPLYNMEAI
jgi:DNA polymerase-3 subunit alpha